MESETFLQKQKPSIPRNQLSLPVQEKITLTILMFGFLYIVSQLLLAFREVGKAP